jgi:mono/diheme cytochrome c family protein
LVCHTPDNQIPMSKYLSRHAIKLFLSFFLVGFFNLSLLAADGDLKHGKELFKANCKTCHKFGTKLTGPALEGVMGRVPSKDWLHKWIHASSVVVKSGDSYAAKLVAANGGNHGMSDFPTLSDQDIDDIIAYIPTGVDDGTTPTATTGGTTGYPECATEAGNDNTIFFVLGSIVILVVLIGVFRQVRISLHNEVNRKKGKPELEEATMWEESKKWMANNRRFLGVCGVVLVLVGMRGCWNELWDIGVYAEARSGQYDLAVPCKDKTYKPEQPIKFSHKIHAGDNAIACQYCHSTVEKSKHAGIPTVNICMNCHKGISTGTNTGETEISKIYAAAGFNPKTMGYENPQNPIRWIKVHNLPDHVSFSHVHHVVVGKQDCANCHGDVKKMTVVEQVSPLTMGWCIDCHRKTEVPGLKADASGMPANPYYQRLHDYYREKYKGQKVKLTVEKIGGIECGKCHY